MKILVVSQNYYPSAKGGAEKVAKTNADLLSRKHEVNIITLTDKTHSEKNDSNIHLVKYKNFYLPKIGKRKNKNIAIKLFWHFINSFMGVSTADLKRLILYLKPDVIYAHNASAFYPQLGNLAKKLKIPIIQHIHDYSLLCPKTSMFDGESNCKKQCLGCKVLTAQWRAAAKAGVTDMIMVSDFVKDRFENAAFAKNIKLHTLYNIDQSMLATDPLSDLSFLPYQRSLGFIGAITKEKGIEQLLAAYDAFSSNLPELLIAGAGDPTYVAFLKDRYRNKKIKWLGQVDPVSFYRNISTLVVPSLWNEPQAMVIQEGMSRGLYVLGSDRGGTTEDLLKYDRGFLFDPTSKEELVGLFSMLLEVKIASNLQVESMAVQRKNYVCAIEKILEEALLSY